MRKPIIVGNWKMNKGPEEAQKFYIELEKLMKNKTLDIEWAIAAPSISMVSLMAGDDKGLYIPLAAQNVHYEKSGAFTGELSLDMLMEYGLEYVIIGHSERRQYFNETDETVNLKIKATLNNSDITPIMAFGETEKEFDDKKTLSVVRKQINNGLKGINPNDAKEVVLAYEPIWAIGTGKTATPKQAQSVIKYSRSIVEEMFGKEVAQEIRIQYGGSMKPENIQELMKQPDIDGGLVGGASLDAKSFFKLLTYKK